MRTRSLAKNVKTTALALCAAVGFSTLFVESIACSRCDDMGPPKVVSIKKEEWVSKQTQALETIKKEGFDKALKVVFDFLKSNAPKEAKYSVVDAFAQKHGQKALEAFYQRAYVDFGFNFTDTLAALEKEKPHVLSYMQSLAYGFAYFGYDGFRAAARLAASQLAPVFPIASRPTPLSATLALMTCVTLMRTGKIDKDRAAGHLVEYITKGKPSFETTGSLLNMLREVKPEALQELSINPNLGHETRELIHEMSVEHAPRK